MCSDREIPARTVIDGVPVDIVCANGCFLATSPDPRYSNLAEVSKSLDWLIRAILPQSVKTLKNMH
jgi:hypothetical protein